MPWAESIIELNAFDYFGHTTTITMPWALHKKLKKIADDRDSSMNILVNTALAHWLAKKGALRLG